MSGLRLFTLLLLFALYCLAQEIVVNPYEGIDWNNVSQHKANLHTHTTASDGKFHPNQIVDIYHKLGYTILSITDHDIMNKNTNRITFPWEKFSEMVTSKGEKGLYENRCSESLGMLAIIGNEISDHHHIGGYFNDFPGSQEIETSLNAITEKKGLAIIFHPGRYKHQYKVDWYIDLLKKYPVTVGMEVYNQGNRYPDDCTLWDSTLSIMMPERIIWGFSGDDAHTKNHIGKNWNVFLLEKLTLQNFRKAIEKGNFYFVYCPDGENGKPARIKRLDIDKVNGVIRIEAIDCERIEWISQGKIVATGNEFKYKNRNDVKGYLRATLYGIDGKSITQIQPFGFSKN
ncbi:MAG: hypothetical protein NC906_00595 [Candidatus Omnitrophica bacterium]|nr:hypothetical protein [Candidatus Omnitrophota bacterium]